MKYLLAISGGVDSVVMLDMLAKTNQHDIVVAHFDHGIRRESAADARFVRALAEQYGLVFEESREELGATASEAVARDRRYAFLRRVALKHGATIATAHHIDDLVETVAINLTRGTGWRGLAVLATSDVERPLLAWTKAAIYDYALQQGLEWVEDETNQADAYLRNQLRRRINLPAEAKTRLAGLRDSQVELREQIDKVAADLLLKNESRFRHFITMIDDASAHELLRSLLAQTDDSLTRPQLDRLLHSVKSAKAGTLHQPGSKVQVQIGPERLIVNHYR